MRDGGGVGREGEGGGPGSNKNARELADIDEEAVVLLDRVLETDSGHWLGLSVLAKRRAFKGREREAIRLLNRAAAAAPWHPSPALHMAKLLVAQDPPPAGRSRGGGGTGWRGGGEGVRMKCWRM